MSKTGKWKKKETENLIHFLKEQPVLCDENHADYRNSSKQKAAKQILCKQIGIKYDRVETKLNYLIKTYEKDLQKPANTKKHWTFDSLHEFLGTANNVSSDGDLQNNTINPSSSQQEHGPSLSKVKFDKKKEERNERQATTSSSLKMPDISKVTLKEMHLTYKVEPKN
ncbi:uncharacterized protein [Euwallacea fornicatus]|uniref:uncharacterized protein n=1 Tax=Euwallacea fornicatus TaxID=995702 RepID=UPI00338F9770